MTEEKKNNAKTVVKPVEAAILEDGSIKYGEETVKPKTKEDIKKLLAMRENTKDGKGAILVNNKGYVIPKATLDDLPKYKMMRLGKDIAPKEAKDAALDKTVEMGFIKPTSVKARHSFSKDFIVGDLDLDSAPNTTLEFESAVPHAFKIVDSDRNKGINNGKATTVRVNKGASIDHATLIPDQTEIDIASPDGKHPAAIKNTILEHIKANPSVAGYFYNGRINDTELSGNNKVVGHSLVKGASLKNATIDNSEIHGGTYINSEAKDSQVWAEPKSMINNSHLVKSNFENRSVNDDNLKKAYQGKEYGYQADDDALMFDHVNAQNADMIHDHHDAITAKDSTLENVLGHGGLVFDTSNLKANLGRPMYVANSSFDHNDIDTGKVPVAITQWLVEGGENKPLKSNAKYDAQKLVDAKAGTVLKTNDNSYRMLRHFDKGQYDAKNDVFEDLASNLEHNISEGEATLDHAHTKLALAQAKTNQQNKEHHIKPEEQPDLFD